MRLSIWRFDPSTEGQPRRRWELRFARRSIFARSLVVTAAVGLVASFASISPPSVAADELAYSAAAASSPYQFSAEPYAPSGAQQRSDFAYELQPGHAILDQLAVLNNTSTPESFVVY